MILYRTAPWGQKIVEEKVDKATKKSVWRYGIEIRRAGLNIKYWDTYEEAKQYLISNCQQRIDDAKSRLSSATSLMEELKKL